MLEKVGRYNNCLKHDLPQKPVPAPPPTPTPVGQVGRGEGLTPCVKSRLAPYFPGVDLNGVRLRFGFPDSSRLAGALLDYVGIQNLNGAAARKPKLGSDLRFVRFFGRAKTILPRISLPPHS